MLINFTSSLHDDPLMDYDNYGKTPPRTRILRKHKEKKAKDLAG